MQKNPIVFWELASHDADRSVQFFRDVFEWEIEIDERLGFYVNEVPEDAPKVDGGIFTLKNAKLPFVALYILVDDIHAKAKLIEEHGGMLVDGVQTMPSGAVICLFNEPSGVTFAMLQKRKQ